MSIGILLDPSMNPASTHLSFADISSRWSQIISKPFLIFLSAFKLIFVRLVYCTLLGLTASKSTSLIFTFELSPLVTVPVQEYSVMI